MLIHLEVPLSEVLGMTKVISIWSLVSAERTITTVAYQHLFGTSFVEQIHSVKHTTELLRENMIAEEDMYPTTRNRF